MSIMYAVEILLINGNNDPEKLDVMLKTMPKNALRVKEINDMTAFVKEVNMYTQVIPEMIKFQEDKGLERSQIYSGWPTCFVTFQDGLNDYLAMEDLRREGFYVADRINGLTPPQISLVLLNLAQFHAISYAQFAGDRTAIMSKYPWLKERLFPPLDKADPNMISWMKSSLISISEKIHEQVETVFGCKTAPEMWDKLSSIYQSTSGENKQALWQKFYLIMADEKSPVKTMIQIQNIASQLRSLGIVIDDVAEVARVISSLAGDKYRQFREAWRSVDIIEKTVIFGTGELTKISEIEDLNCFVVTNETPSFCKPVMNVKDEIIATNITENNVKIPRYKNGKDYQSQRPHRTKSTEEAPPEQAVIPVTRRDDTKKSNQRNPGKNKKKRTNARVLIPKNYCKFNAPWSEEFEMLKLFFSIRILVLIRFHGREVFFRREKGTHFHITQDDYGADGVNKMLEQVGGGEGSESFRRICNLAVNHLPRCRQTLEYAKKG
ncbi:hypothetical protein Fcan01_20682 [Folsomia candida]|uniref:Uncharacterized protein n=1 Tax=Folsomia candida TaxID=158441 RepID=A0A226DKG2_FOLCA|nr:hypothetical protein Fcan01_20682 [Folsomia candida]